MRTARARRALSPLLVVALLAVAACTATPDTEASPEDTVAPTVAASPTPTPTPTPTSALGGSGVSAGHPLAADAGMEMLRAGGTAYDAAVATAFADAVLQPYASGIGGGGNAVVVDADGATENFDFRETLSLSGSMPANRTGTPGFVAGMAALHEAGGALDWSAVLEPAIRLAEQGAVVTPYVASHLASAPAGVPRLGAGATLSLPELAATMRVLQSEGPSAFYTGSLVPSLTTVPGIDAASLAAYSVQRTQPPRGAFAGYSVVSASPALAGAALIQQLQIAEAAGIAGAAPGSGAFAAIQTRAWRVAEASVRALSDPAFGPVPTEALTDPAANAALVSAPAAGPDASVRPASVDVAGNTTHISVVDEEGRAVSMTNTIMDFWGSRTSVGGFFLNNQLVRFGQTPDPARPGARPVSWSAPTILLDDQNRPVLVLGTPGGRQILNVVAQIATLWAVHRLPLDQAVEAARFHGEPNGTVSTESPELARDLQSQGVAAQSVGRGPQFGSMQALAIDWTTGAVSGYADPRRTAGFTVDPP